MKRKLLFVLLLLLLAEWPNKLSAQSLTVRLNDGSENQELLASVQKLSFADGNLVLSFKTGANNSFPLQEIQKVYFGTQTGLTEILPQHTDKLYIYPNPATQEIMLTHIPAGTSLVFIYRMDGKLMMQCRITGDTSNINLNNLQSGIYLLVAGNQTSKFIKL